jgi:Ca-activated chloride channel family protein
MTHRRCSKYRCHGLGLLGVAAAVLGLWAVRAQPAEPAPGDPVELFFVYGSEKEKWVEAATKDFLATKPVVGGHEIRVKTKPLGSGETVEDVLEGRLKAHLISPASLAYLKLGNAWSQKKDKKPLILDEEPQPLVYSPVVIAMWKPMAEALGWPDKPIGWKDLRELANSKDGWGSKGHPDWGQFKFGHTHPERSNSGLTALIEQMYAATGKKKLTPADVKAPATAEFLKDMQRAVTHYGSSTGFFSKEMFGNGMDNLSAAVLYENLVTDTYSKDPKKNPFAGKMEAEVVAIYPKEGTMWSDHPVAIVDREWVSAAHKDAAREYIKFLLSPEQQKKALDFGFRPALGSVKLGPPIDKAHGVDPNQPGTNELLSPEADVLEQCLALWHKNKKHARIALVFDQSESMSWEPGKLENAKAGAKEIIRKLGDEDDFALLVFNHKLDWKVKGTKLKGNRERLEKIIDDIPAKGKTALYQAIAEAYQHLQAWPNPDVITAIVVLTDGCDSDSKIKLNDLLRQIRVDNKTNVTRVYTIAYGEWFQLNEDSDAKLRAAGVPAGVRAKLQPLVQLKARPVEEKTFENREKFLAGLGTVLDEDEIARHKDVLLKHAANNGVPFQNGVYPDVEVLKKIADVTKAKAYEGKRDTIREVVLDVATFF